MRAVAKALWTEPVLFLSACAAVFTVGGGVAVQLGAPPAVAIVCGAIGPVVSASARSHVWSAQVAATHGIRAARRKAPR
jgi:hypothetical protein